MARVPGADELRLIERKLRDIGNRIDGITKFYDRWTSDVKETVSKHRDLTTEIDRINSAMAGVATGSNAWVRMQGRVRDLNHEISRLPSGIQNVSKLVGGKLLSSFDKLGKSIVMLGLDTFRIGIGKLENAIIQIYNVHEKWARLMGEFRNRIGVATRGIGQLGKVASSVEGKIYGLTGAFGQGAPMVADFIEGLERVQDVVNPKNLNELIKSGIYAGRVLGITANEAGQLTFALQQMGEDVGEQKDLFLDMSAGAHAAGVSTAAFGKEIVQSRSFLTSFGKEGRRMFVQMATYARSLGVSLKSLEAFTKITDTFDSTATSVAKLNTVFGTTISSLDLMLEQDPSKRLETVRQALLAQGKSFDQLSRQERMFLGETMNLSQEELAGVIRTGKSLEDVQKDQEKARVDQERSQKNMAKLINKTSTTLFAFAQAWDRVWMAVQRLIRPFTNAIGLTKSGDKDAKSFSQTMKGLFDRFVKFIDEVAANPEWQGFMRRLAGDAVDLAKKISEVATGSNLKEWIHTVVDAAQDFYGIMKSTFKNMLDVGRMVTPILKFVLSHIKEIVISWAAFKGLSAGVGIAKDVKGLAATLGGKGGKGGMLGKGAKMALGFAGSPYGLLIAGAGVAGLALYKLAKDADRGAPARSYTEQIQERINKQGEKNLAIQRYRDSLEAQLNAKRKVERDVLSQGVTRRGQLVSIEGEQLKTARDLITRMTDLGVKTGLTKDELAALSGKSGPVRLSGGALERLVSQSDEYNKRLDELAASTSEMLGLTQLQNQITLGQKRIELAKASAGRLGAEAEVSARSQGQKDVADALSEGRLDDAAEIARKRTAGIEERIGLEKRIKSGEKLNGHEAGHLKYLQNRFPIDERSLKNNRELEQIISKAVNAQQAKLKLDLREMQFTEKSLQLQALQLQLQDSVNQDLLQAIAGAKGDLGQVIGSGRFSGEKLALLRGLMSTGAEVKKLGGLQSGGIVTRPTRALIGEAGPEAIIPLRAMAHGADARQPSKFGGQAAAKMMNMVSRPSKSGADQVRVAVGDVYLDSRLVGRTMVRSYLENVENG